ncbi:MAG: T9SS type A sorting domain-containing protein, partial [candidate division KSB1 bacterium]|nr:T9SS type A sorting domain-containing protein [candidate division KSB1 bacterium]
ALHIDSLYAEIDRLNAEIAEALPRNFQKYPAMLRGATYEAKLQELKDWIANRLRWIDANIGALASNVEESGRPLTLRLEQNYPNPFNPTTTIVFSLEKKGRAVLEIFDLRGRSVEKLVDGDFYPSDYQVTWRADAHPAGVYLYRLSAEGLTLQKKMTFVK